MQKEQFEGMRETKLGFRNACLRYVVVVNMGLKQTSNFKSYFEIMIVIAFVIPNCFLLFSGMILMLLPVLTFWCAELGNHSSIMCI